MAPALAGKYDLRSLKKCVSAGEALPDATRQLFKQATGIEIIDGLGSTEMIHIFISHSDASVCAAARPATRSPATRRRCSTTTASRARPASSAGSR